MLLRRGRRARDSKARSLDEARRAAQELAEREAHIVGIKDFSTPTLEAVDRRRSQLWTMTFAGLVSLAVVVAILSSQRAHYLGFANQDGFRIGTVALVMGLALYVVEKERHLRRLARLLTDERVLGAALSNRLKELAVLYEAGKAMNSVLAVDEVLGLILSSAFELLEASSGSIMLLDGDGELQLVSQAADSTVPVTVPIEVSRKIGRQVVKAREPLLLKPPPPGNNENVIGNAVCVPLIHRGEALGVLTVHSGEGHLYSEHDLRAVALFAEHAAISVANARLYQAERELTARLETKVELGTAELQARDARFTALVQNSSDLVTIIDGNTKILFQSPSLQRVLGWDGNATLGTSLLGLVHDSDKRRWGAVVDLLGTTRGGETVVEWQLRHADGSWRFVQSVITNLVDEPSVGGWVLNSRDITDQKVLEDQLRHQAFHDPLTKLANRALFSEHLDQALRRRSRVGGKLALLFIDLDSFKAINDLHGHAIGDEVLKRTADRLRTTFRHADAIVRLGGDEFAVLFEGIPVDSHPSAAAERLITALEAPFQIGTAEIFVTASMGMAVDENGTESAEDLLRNADLAMYAAKAKNKGGYELFSAGMHSTILDRMKVESELRRAVDQDEFVVQYQPIVNLTSRVITGLEALIRWNHPQRGLVMPDEFIPVAETSDMIVNIGNWMLYNACREFEAVTRNTAGSEMMLNINLSARQLVDPALLQTVQDALTASGLDVHRLTIEITEGAIIDDVANTVLALERLRSSGVTIAIDDFGTGYSSLSLLNEIPVDMIKIDRVFVRNVSRGKNPTRLIRSILLLARDLGLRTVAEGLEDLEQMQILESLGCQAGQGYHLARPMFADRLSEVVRAGNQLSVGIAGGG